MKSVVKHKFYIKKYSLRIEGGSVPITVQFYIKDYRDIIIDTITLLLTRQQIVTKVKLLIIDKEEPEDINLLPFFKTEVLDFIQHALEGDHSLTPQGCLNVLDIRHVLNK